MKDDKYDKNSNIISFKNRAGQTIYYTYDALSRLISKSRPSETTVNYTYDIAGRLVDIDNGTDEISYDYDRVGRLRQVDDQYEKTIKYEYDKLSRRTKLTYPDNSYITYEYDSLGRLIYIKDDSATPVILAAFDWDELSRLTKVTYANGQYEEYDYEDAGSGDDDLGDNVEQVYYSPSSMNSYDYLYDKVGNVTEKSYDSLTYDFAYDKIYQLIVADFPASSDDWQYYYGKVNNRTLTINNGNQVSYLRNRLNQYTSVNSITFSYDNNGNRKQLKYIFTRELDMNSMTNWWRLDEISGQTVFDYVDSNDGTVYGSPGQMANGLDFDGVQDYIELGDLDTIVGPNSFTLTAWVYPEDGNGTILSKTANTDGNYAQILLKIDGDCNVQGIFSNGSTVKSTIISKSPIPLKEWSFVAFSWNGTTGPNSIKLYINDSLSKAGQSVCSSIVNTDSPAYIGVYSHIGACPNYFTGRIDSIRIFNKALSQNEIETLYNHGTIINYAYNISNNLIGITAVNPYGEPNYTFDVCGVNGIDGLGRLKLAVENITYPGGANRSHTSSFAYNMQSGLTAGSITNINGSTWTAGYSYKKDGNIEEKTVNSQETDYTYDGDIMTDAGDDDLTWNENGQLAQTPTISFNYNWDGKLRSATFSGDSISLKYDPTGNRVYKASTINGNRRYIVDISSGLPVILCEIDPSNGSLKKAYIYSNGQILAQDNFEAAEPNRFCYIHDRLGSIRLVVNDAGDVKNSYTYNPFGEMFATECTENTENPFKFTGQWFDSEIGQYYLRARMYDPVLMRMTSYDPVRGKYKEPLTLHLYLYCQNDPINYIDRNGKMFEFLLESAIEAKLRLADIQFNKAIYDRSKCILDSYSMMNLQRGMMYDLMVRDAENGFRGSVGSAVKNITLMGLQAISPNIARIAQVGIFGYENKETIGNILKGNASSYDYYELTGAIFNEMLPSDESGDD